MDLTDDVVVKHKHVIALYYVKTAKQINAESENNYAPVSYGSVAYAAC